MTGSALTRWELHWREKILYKGRGLGRGGLGIPPRTEAGGFMGPPKMKKNHSVFEVFRRWRGKLGFLTSKNRSVFEVSGGWMVKNPSVFEVFT